MGKEKINPIEAWFALGWLGFWEIVEMFTGWIPGASLITTLIISPVYFWAWMKGLNTQWKKNLAAILIDALPLINMLPSKTILLAVTIKIHNKTLGLPVPLEAPKIKLASE